MAETAQLRVGDETYEIPIVEGNEGERASGTPANMFTALFGIGRLPGWIAHWMEMHSDPDSKIGRPRQIHTGPKQTAYVPLDRR